MSTPHLFITGGTGFFGKSLLRYWTENTANRPIQVSILTRSPKAFLDTHSEFRNLDWVTFYEGDITCKDTFPDLSCSHVLHAATDSTYGPQLPPIVRYDQIVSGTRNVLDFAVRAGAKRFILTSTGGVYGKPPQEMDKIPETYCGFPDPLRPENVHSIAKRAAEHLCILYSHQFRIEPVIARCFAFVGIDLPLDVHFAIGNFIRDATQGKDIIIQGDGTSVRSYLDQHDLAAWLTRLLDIGHPQTAYNVGSETAISIKDLATLVRDLVHPTGSVQILGQQGNQAATRYVPDTRLARETLGLSQTVSLPDAIRSALRPC